MDISNVFTLLGGVAMFLFGMTLMGEGLKKVAGNRLETILYKLTNTPFKSVILGTLVTAVIQSSSATTVMVVGFVNSGMMKLAQAIGIIMGANIGTSITGWILCLSNLESDAGAIASLFSTATISATFAIIGIIMRMFSKKHSIQHIGDILLGFSVLMFGMQSMSGAVSPLKDSESFTSLLSMFENPFIGILIGILITMVLQSASASVGIIQALSLNGALTCGAALPMIMGIGIGASVPVLLSSIGANANGKRSAVIYLINDLLGTIIWGTIFYSVNHFVNFSFLSVAANPVLIALMNSAFRIATVIILFPFIKYLEKLVCFLIHDKIGDEDETTELNLLEERFLANPSIAVEQSFAVMSAMARKAVKNFERSVDIFNNFTPEKLETIKSKEDIVDMYEDRIGTYLVKVMQHELTQELNIEVSKYLHTMGDFERISDHALNIAENVSEINEDKLSFSETAAAEIENLSKAVLEIVHLAQEAFLNNDMHVARRIEPLEELVDILCDSAKHNHVMRVQNNTCTIHMGFIFNDLITNFERVADHCSNIAVAMLALEEECYDTHEYLSTLKRIKTEKYLGYFEQYKSKYAPSINE